MTLIGQQTLIKRLHDAAAADKLAHAYLMCGAAGSGKRTLAKEIAMLMMCPDGGCGSCAVCHKVRTGIHPDVIVTSGANKNGTYSVDQIRALRADVFTMPNEGRRKIYIINNAELMPAQAQDAFLKVLEEPPAYAVFLLLCADAGKMLATVLSRTVRLNMAVPSEEESTALIAERANVPKATARAALRLCGGSIGQALALLEKDDPAQLTAECEEFCGYMLEGSAYDMALFARKKAADKQKFSAFLDLLALYFRDILIYKRTSNAALLAFGDSVKEQPGLMRLRVARIARVTEGLLELRKLSEGKYNANVLEAKLVSICLSGQRHGSAERK